MIVSHFQWTILEMYEEPLSRAGIIKITGIGPKPLPIWSAKAMSNDEYKLTIATWLYLCVRFDIWNFLEVNCTAIALWAFDWSGASWLIHSIQVGMFDTFRHPELSWSNSSQPCVVSLWLVKCSQAFRLDCTITAQSLCVSFWLVNWKLME